MNRIFGVIIEKDADGYYAYCSALQGCHTQGDTFEEATVNIKEAVELDLKTMSDQEKDECFSREIVTTSLEVHVALTGSGIYHLTSLIQAITNT